MIHPSARRCPLCLYFDLELSLLGQHIENVHGRSARLTWEAGL